MNNDAFAKRLAEASPEELLELRNALDAEKQELTRQLSVIDQEVGGRFRPHVEDAYREEGKQAGKVRVDLTEQIEVVADVTKKVEWDQEKLRRLANELPWGQTQHIMKITLAVPETTFKALPPSDLKDQLQAARTVKFGEPKIGLARKE